jgi:hypothetical protein
MPSLDPPPCRRPITRTRITSNSNSSTSLPSFLSFSSTHFDIDIGIDIDIDSPSTPNQLGSIPFSVSTFVSSTRYFLL